MLLPLTSLFTNLLLPIIFAIPSLMYSMDSQSYFLFSLQDGQVLEISQVNDVRKGIVTKVCFF